jgi:hypothetical protein
VASAGDLAAFGIGIAVIAGLVALGYGCYYCQQQSSSHSGEDGCLKKMASVISSSSSSFSVPRSSKRSGEKEARAVELARFERMGQRSDAYPNPNKSGTDNDDYSEGSLFGSGGGESKKTAVLNPLGGQRRWPKNAEDSASLI